MIDRQSPSSKNRHFQNETKCKTFLVETSVICIRINISIAGTTQKMAIIGIGKVGQFFSQLFECAKCGKGKFFIFIFSFRS